MKFLVDAQLPLSLKTWLRKQGYDTIHTRDLPRENLSDDAFIIDLAEKENRIIITKDSDFFKAHLINGLPKQLLMITTGNIVNKDLLLLFEANFPAILSYFDKGANIIELSNHTFSVH